MEVYFNNHRVFLIHMNNYIFSFYAIRLPKNYLKAYNVGYGIYSLIQAVINDEFEIRIITYVLYILLYYLEIIHRTKFDSELSKTKLVKESLIAVCVLIIDRKRIYGKR